MGSKELFYWDAMASHPEVTGSCHPEVVKLPNGETFQFIVDCGLFQEKEYGELNRKLHFKGENIKFALVTHNHVDHIGRLPYIVKNGFRGDIYTTRDTSILMPLALADSQKVLRSVSRKRNEKLLYDEGDVFRTEALLSPVGYYETKKINDYVKITFIKNGHLVGAALILVQICYPGYDSINILFTGDYNNKNIFLDLPKIPKWILELPLTIVMESTYGYMDSTGMKQVFKDNVASHVKKRGTIIAPVFSLGRAQEILYELKCMQDDGELNRDVPIYFDGKLAIKYTELYLKGKLDIKPEMIHFLPDNIIYVNKLNRADVLDSTYSKIVLTTSGMGSYGPAQTYIPRYISREDALIHFTGYTAEGTLGSRLKNAGYGENVEVGGIIAKKCARVEYTTEFSAHAKADEMLSFLKQFSNLKLVLVNHGQTEVKKQFAKRILDEVKPKDVGILGEDYFFRVNSYGLVKTFPSKFK